MTSYGICPSFANWTSRLPLFANPIRRGRMFEIFQENGTPTGEPAPVGPDGWPIEDGRWHGVRMFGDMDGQTPELHIKPGVDYVLSETDNAMYLSWMNGGPIGYKPTLKHSFGNWHLPSGEALAYFKPKALRTLDWGYQARKAKRPDWSKPRVKHTDPLQGEEMALELQIEAANLLNCHLWWNVPPRFELVEDEYKIRLEEFFTILKANAKKPPILEYGNELWNDAFPVRACYGTGPDWTTRAAYEISLMAELADQVFNEKGILGERSFYTFVGGHIAVPNVLEFILRNLSFIPDAAGPAFYVTPLKADRDRWNETGEIPTQDQLKESMLGNIPKLRDRLDSHKFINKKYHVPFFAVYEAGQSLISNGKPWKKAAIEAQKTEWMGNIYFEIGKQLQEAGVDLACWYSAATDQEPQDSRVDVFGLLDSCDVSKALPKAKAARGD